MIRYPDSPFGPAVGEDEAIASPCINVCELDDEGMCTGCFRTAEEIAAWPGMGPVDQRRLLAVLETRQAVASGIDVLPDESAGEVRG